MAPKKNKFRQPEAQHFQLVHRSQRDPLIHDPEASTHVFKPFERENVKKGKSRADLEKVLSPEELKKEHARPNIGQAAEYGIYFDDSEYDYMQHLRTVGEQEDGVESVLLDATTSSARARNTKNKQKDVLTFQDPTASSSSSAIPAEFLASETELPRNYESQQNIPSSISGFQPDMNPHLRQTLEALEDDAFVNDGLEDDFFGDLLVDGEVSNDSDLDFPFEEWGVQDGGLRDDSHGHQSSAEGAGGEKEEGWEARFAQFKKEQDGKTHDDDGTERDMAASEGGDTIGTLPQLGVTGIRKRRRKGGSDASGYSMSSSSMYRNQHLSILDEQFDHIMEKQYNSEGDELEDESSSTHDDDDDEPPLLTNREDFDSILDEFMDKYEVVGGKLKPVLEGDTPATKLETLRRAMTGVDLGGGIEAKIAIQRYAEKANEDGDDSIPMPYDVDDIADRWDCETILSTYSNLENHPRIIRVHDGPKIPKIRLDPKTGLPITSDGERDKNHFAKQRTTKIGIESVDRSILRNLVSGRDGQEHIKRETVARPRNETMEEKMSRKQAVKEEKQDRRASKKMMKEVFANEKRGQEKALLGRVQGGQGLRKL